MAYLKREKIDIIQLGGKEDEKLNNVLNYSGITDISQSAYVLANSTLLVGNDSMLAHLAGSMDVPVVSLYGPTTPDCHGPYWHTENSVFIEADRDGNHPSYSFHDPNVIKNIKPEVVAKNILKILNLKLEDNILTIEIGSRYNDNIIELVPDSLVPANFLPEAPINVRNDYLDSPEIVYRQLQVRKCVVITKTPLDVNILNQLKKHVISVSYEIDKNHNVEFVKNLKKAGVPFNLFTHYSKEELNKIKLDYFDLGVIKLEKKLSKTDLKNPEMVNSNTKFKTNKRILSNGKFFISKAHLALDINTENFLTKKETIIDTPKFWEELEFIYLFSS